MQMIIFGKNVSYQNKTFTTYFTRLTNRKTGETKSFNVKFRQTAGQPEYAECPCIIEVPREKFNYQERLLADNDGNIITDDNGVPKTSRVIWISEWEMVGPFVDHSLDDFE